jgi:hypothetical protein
MKPWSSFWWLIIAMAVQVLTAAWCEAQPGQAVGRVIVLEGQATVQHAGSLTRQPLKLEGPIYQQDVIRTAAASRIQIAFVDDTVVNLGEKTTMEITRFVYTAPQQAQTVLLPVPLGVFRAIVKKLAPQSTFEVTTPTAIAAIRGTDFMGEVTAEMTSFVVLEGFVALFSARTIFRGIVALTAGLGSSVSHDQPPSAPTPWREARIEALRRATTGR